MTDFSVFLDDVRTWITRPDLGDEVVTTFVRMAETTLSPQMRVTESIVVATTNIDADGRISLPLDYNEMKYLRPIGGKPYLFKVMDEFLAMDETWRHFTVVGSQLLVGGAMTDIPGTDMEMAYYTKVPKFTVDSTWLHLYYYNIFLQSCCAAGALYSEEYDKASSITNMVAGLITAANTQSIAGQFGGSVLKKSVPRRIG